jgi:precorrin-6Y C5,15-methyltransferase (decarboxylating)
MRPEAAVNDVHVIGLGMGPDDLTGRMRDRIAEADVLAGGRRLLDYFPDFGGRRLVLAGDLGGWLDAVLQAARTSRVVVLASGDPGFYGVADRLVRRLGPERVTIHPNLTAVQAAFARLKIPWQDVKTVSLHGRDDRELYGAMARHAVVAAYTDPKRSPDRIARSLIDRGQTGWRMWVLENLGRPDERVGAFDLPEAAALSFSDLNVVVLQRTRPPRPPRLGMPEEAFEHESGLITKTEVRTAILGRLELGPDLCLWDLGAGCGSVAIEASLFLTRGRVVAVERRPDRVDAIRANARKFGAVQVEVVQADLPQGLDDLPDPDRVFIGGGGSALADLIDRSARRLTPGGIMTASVVRVGGLETARRAMMDAGLEVNLVQIQIGRGRPLGDDVHFQALNPVWLITGRKSPAQG